MDFSNYVEETISSKGGSVITDKIGNNQGTKIST